MILLNFLMMFTLQNVHAGIVNKSPIHLTKPNGQKNSTDQCDGDIGKQREIQDSVIAAVKKGVRCIATDLDNNGYLDFIIFDGEDDETYAYVFLYKGSQLIKSQALSGKLTEFKKDAPERSRYPKHKNEFGLILRGEEPPATIYFFNQKALKFENEVYIYSNGKAESMD